MAHDLVPADLIVQAHMARITEVDFKQIFPVVELLTAGFPIAIVLASRPRPVDQSVQSAGYFHEVAQTLLSSKYTYVADL